MDKELLQKIKSELPAGSMAEIARMAETSKGTVRNFFDGKTANIKIMKAVTELYSEYKKSCTELTALAQTV